MRNFIISHYHKFVHDYRNKNNQLDILDIDKRTGKTIDTLKVSDTPIKFKTIFVDETQDYERSWMEEIFKFWDPQDGEIVFFGDQDQDIYQRHQMAHIPNILGRWVELKRTYRLNSKIAILAKEFQNNFLINNEKNSTNNFISSPISLFNDNEATIDYIFTSTFEIEEIFTIFKNVLKKYSVHNDDVCIMSQVISCVRMIDKKIRDSGYKTIRTFEKQETYQIISQKYPELEKLDKKLLRKIRNELSNKLTEEEKEIKKLLRAKKQDLETIRRIEKYNFQMESGKIKLSTIQSYKGWGINTEILILDNEINEVDDNDENEETFLNSEMIYTGITRATNHLVIININNEKYDQFFRKHIANDVEIQDDVNDNKLKRVLENAFNLALQKELFIVIIAKKGDLVINAQFYIPQIGYYEREYKKRGMLSLNRYSILTIDYSIFQMKGSKPKVKYQNMFKDYPEGVKDSEVSDFERVQNAVEHFLKLVDEYLPDARKKNFSCSDTATLLNPQTKHPYLYLEIIFD